MEVAAYPVSTAEIVLRRKDGDDLMTLVDVADLPLLEPYTWYAFVAPHTTYAVANTSRTLGPRRVIRMHILLMGFPAVDVDHVDRNGLNNTRRNLRLATRSQNLGNMRGRGGTSQYKGVSLHRASGLWRVRIARQQLPGYFHDEEDAARAYDGAAVARWGEFARLNFPEGGV